VVLTLTSIPGAFTLSELVAFIGIPAHAFCAIESTRLRERQTASC
jgi:hypothetical protein